MKDALIGYVHFRSIDALRYDLMLMSNKTTYFVYRNEKYDITLPPEYLSLKDKINVIFNDKLNYIDYKNDIKNSINVHGYYPRTFTISSNDNYVQITNDNQIQIPNDIV